MSPAVPPPSSSAGRRPGMAACSAAAAIAAAAFAAFRSLGLSFTFVSRLTAPQGFSQLRHVHFSLQPTPVRSGAG